MAIRTDMQDRLPGLEFKLKDYTDTSFHYYEIHDLHKRLISQPIHPISLKLKESGLLEAVGFPMVV